MGRSTSATPPSAPPTWPPGAIRRSARPRRSSPSTTGRSGSPPEEETSMERDDSADTRGHAVVVQPDERASYWQPVPASGHADPTLVPANTRFGGLSMGYQTIAPGGRVREHSHGAQV